MLNRLSRLAVTRPKAVLAATLVLMVAAVAYGSGISDRLSGGGFYSVSSESQRAAALLEQRFHVGKPNLLVLATDTGGGSVDDPDAIAAGQALTQELAATTGITSVASYWGPGTSQLLRSDDGTKALVVAHIEGDEREFAAAARRLIATYRDTERGPLKLELGGEAVSYDDVTDQLNHDLGISEAIAMPVILVLMTLVFGSLVAAGLPLAIGALSIVGSLGLLALLSDVTPVSNYALNVTTILGLALAIDYSLLVLTRFREARTQGQTLDDAIIESVRTAGRTVVFSAITVALSVLALLAFPMMFLRSIAYACVGVILLAAVCAVVVLPALLRILGPRVDSLNVGRAILRLMGRRPPAEVPAKENGFWFRSSRLVMRRPVAMGGAVLIVALVLAAPFSAIRLNFPDDRSLPTTIESRSVGDVVRSEFPAQATAAMDVILDASAGADQLDAYAASVVTVATRRSRQGGNRELRRGATHRRHAGARRQRFLSNGSPRRRSIQRRGAPAARSGARNPISRCRACRRTHCRELRYQRFFVRTSSVGCRTDGSGDVRRTVRVYRKRGIADKGTATQCGQPVRDSRRDGVRLPGGSPQVAGWRLHCHRDTGYTDADPHHLSGVWIVHGLRGVSVIANH